MMGFLFLCLWPLPPQPSPHIRVTYGREVRAPELVSLPLASYPGIPLPQVQGRFCSLGNISSSVMFLPHHSAFEKVVVACVEGRRRPLGWREPRPSSSCLGQEPASGP